jgi:microcystin-dependent protein
MADLVVHPSYVLGPSDILTVDKINLMATPVVELAIAEPVNDQNFLRNGNFYSSFWAVAAGQNCPPGVETSNANYWYVNPAGATIVCLRSNVVPDTKSLFSMQLTGAPSTTLVLMGQNINGDLSATLRRICTFSGQIFNSTGLQMSPKLDIYSCDAFNNFSAKTLQTQVDLQTCANGIWTFVSATLDLSPLANIANGISVVVEIPTGSLSSSTSIVNFSRLKFQIGELATEFVDDVSLFVQAPSVDSTMLQDGCLARPSLYVTAPGVIPKNAYSAASIQGTDIGTGEVKGKNLDPGISTTTSALFTTPAVNANVNITLTSVTAISAGLVLNVQGAGLYSTVSVAGNVVTAMNTGAAGNASSGTAIASGATVTTSGNAVTSCLGYTPVNKAGDTVVGSVSHTVDTVSGTPSAWNQGVVVQTTAASAANDGYIPAISFVRPGQNGRMVGLAVDGRLRTIDQAGVVGYLLDSVHQVDTASYQDKSVTLAKLADSLVNTLIPSGITSMFSGPTPPAGWLVCDGSAVSRTTYAKLFTAIGTVWGAGDNISTFNLPDLRGRAPIGYANTPAPGITTRAFGSKGGEETHPLSSAEMPNHTHVVNDPTHTHGFVEGSHYHQTNFATAGFASGGTPGLTGSGGAIGVQSQPNSIVTAGIVQAAYTNISLNAAGSNVAHNNMQPFGVLYFIIKT